MRIMIPASLLVLTAIGCSDPGPTPPSVARLSEMLKDADAKVQLEGAAWVKQMGPKAADAVPGLIVALKSSDKAVRQSVAVALGHVGLPAAEPAIPALTTALGDPEDHVRNAAADTLGQFGPAAASAIPALESLTKQPSPCNSAQAALKKIRS